MTRLAVLLAVIGFPMTLAAQPHPAGIYGEEDRLELERVAADFAVVTYSNSADSTSASGDFTLTAPGLEVIATIQVGGEEIGYAERLIITAPEGWTVMPEMLEVLDGDIGVVELFRGEFLGM